MFTTENLHHTEVHVSEILESHGIPDPYFFKFNKKGQLISQYDETETPVEDVIIKDNYLGGVEYEAFLKIQQEALTRNSGYILWISPRYGKFYPTPKIVLSEINFEDNTKKLLNRAIVTNWDDIGTILAAQELALLGNLDPNIFNSPTAVRANPIFIDKEKETELSLALKRILDQKSIEMMATGADFAAKERFMTDSLAGNQIPLGQHPLSCPTAFQIFSGEDEYGSLHFECPHCHKTNTREQGKLISNCQHCGCDVTCGIVSAV